MEEFDKQFAALLPALQRLQEEVGFILNTAVSQAEIKTHSIISRIKKPDSISEKAIRKNLTDPLESLDDLVGLRVVCLLRSDIEKLGALIREQFDVHVEDNKVDGSPIDAFGYQSVHFIATLRKSYTGPRYEGLHTLRFEIQVRTLAMDAWAALSHYLDYKSESDVPKALRKDFFALSGLFYIADTHFEMFYSARQESKFAAQRTVTVATDEQQELNLDTLTAYLTKRYPDRKHSDAATVSELVSQLASVGYKTLHSLHVSLDASQDAFAKYESSNPPGGSMSKRKHFTDVGAVRLSLAIADSRFAQVMGYAHDDKSVAYRKYVLPFPKPG